MDQKIVVNTTGVEIVAYFDGQNIYFKPGQKKSFAEGIAAEIIRENDGLKIESDVVEAPEEVAPEVAEKAPVKKAKAKK